MPINVTVTNSGKIALPEFKKKVKIHKRVYIGMAKWFGVHCMSRSLQKLSFYTDSIPVLLGLRIRRLLWFLRHWRTAHRHPRDCICTWPAWPGKALPAADSPLSHLQINNTRFSYNIWKQRDDTTGPCTDLLKKYAKLLIISIYPHLLMGIIRAMGPITDGRTDMSESSTVFWRTVYFIFIRIQTNFRFSLPDRNCLDIPLHVSYLTA